jgi:peptidoglycan/LPS O-acetylase OafA/YrhL
MLNPLTSLRFFAAFSVFLFHLNMFDEGYSGVSFFFILSGFILTYNYHDKFSSKDKISLIDFYIARISRIYPLHLLTFILALPLLYPTFFERPLLELLKLGFNLLLVQSFIPFPEFFFANNGVSWSLSTEMFFYLILPLILFSFNKIKGNKKLISILIIIWIFCTAIVYIFRDISLNRWMFYIFPPFRLADFLIGVILALLFKKFKNVNINNKVASLFEVASVLLLVFSIYFASNVHPSFKWGMYYAPFMSLIILVFAYQKGVFSKILSSRIFIFLGEISFSFYMIHQVIYRYLLYIPYLNKNRDIFFLLCLICTLASSIIMYKFFEGPCRNAIKNVWSFYLTRMEKGKKVA